MRSLDTFTPHNPQEKAAMVLSKQLCFEGEELFKQERIQEALDTYRQDLQLCGEVCGKNHSYFANSLWDMAACYYRLDQFDFALTLFSRAREIHEKACGPDHFLTARDLNGMAYCLTLAEQYDQALALRYRQLDIVEKHWGPESEMIVSVIGEIATLYKKRAQLEQTILFHKRKLEIEEKLYGAESSQAIKTVMEIAEAYENLKQYKHALPLRQRVLAYYEHKGGGVDSKDVVAALRPVAYCLGHIGRRDLALTMLQRAVEMNREIYERENLQTANLFLVLSETFEALDDSAASSKLIDWGIRIKWDIIGTADEELHKGAMDGELKRVRKALKNGAEVDAKDKCGRTALIEAANHGQLEVAELLIELGADVNCADWRGRTPLSSAVAHAHPEIFELLLQYGADADAPGDEGRTLLMECCINNPAMFGRLVEQNPDLERRDRFGKTALILAAEWGHLDAVDALLARGAEVDAAADGSTALMYAAQGMATQSDADYLGIVRRLLGAGADPAIRDRSGKTALDYARSGDEIMGVRVVQEGVVELLESFEQGRRIVRTGDMT